MSTAPSDQPPTEMGQSSGGISPAPLRTGGNDAVCFTSGPAGVPFSAGVIHAWLATDRKPPLVAAGISMGAVSAAALQRVYRELGAAGPDDLEGKRWDWFRRYLSSAVDNPNAAIWNSIPDPVDFFAETPPVRDLSVPPELVNAAEEERRHYYVLTKLGVWLAHLPVRLSTVANIVVAYVRLKEGYGNRLYSTIWIGWNSVKASLGVCWHVLRSPSRFDEKNFRTRHRSEGRHALFGEIYRQAVVLSVLLLLVLPGLTLMLSHVLLGVRWGSLAFLVVALFSIAFWPTIGGVILLCTLLKRGRTEAAGGKLNKESFPVSQGKRLLKELDITTALLKPYELKRQIHDLFVMNRPRAPAAGSSDADVKLLAVCAALELIEQVCLEERTGKSPFNLADVLTAALAVGGLYPPQRVARANIACSDDLRTNARELSLMDGSSVRSNPIPAFFEWCKHPANVATARRLEDASGKPTLHVVYNVPIEPVGNVAKAKPPASVDIVESGLQALKLEKRRDTRQEVRQTCFTSRLHAIRRKLPDYVEGPRGPFVVFADEIAPKTDLDLGNMLKPKSGKLIKMVAEGCRATLETLYREDIKNAGGTVTCSAFLTSHAGRRKPDERGCLSGLPEVCTKCSGFLRYGPEPNSARPPVGILRSYGGLGTTDKQDVAQDFYHLDTDKPKVVFLGSGGVFRGAFHIGVLAAMTTVRLYPDLVIGASVGSLMGGALAHMSAGPAENEAAVLGQLAALFLEVDTRVALTRTLKNASKQLGTRARNVKLAPSELARMVNRGSQADPGYASTGAPPALIDALSYLFTIPHRKTSDIASAFIAGHISEATARFVRQVRKETLASFDIETAIMGASMLAVQARRLLGGGVPHGSYEEKVAPTPGVHLNTVQPYHQPVTGRKRVSLFSVTSYLNARTSLLLGRDFLTSDPTWEAVNAGLSSSAFPLVFAPRTEADVLPGRGRTDRFFADGGMFDNLPFFPAIEVLSAVQLSSASNGDAGVTQSQVKARAARPNLFISAGLNARPGKPEPYDTLFKIIGRAESLSVESKVSTFINGSLKTVNDLTAIGEHALFDLPDKDLEFLKGAVSARVINISPTDAEHINPTFAFCKSTGLKKERVQSSIADGCFQSLAAFCDDAHVQSYLRSSAEDPDSVAVVLVPVKLPHGTKPPNEKTCPYYASQTGLIGCPFLREDSALVNGIFNVCVRDAKHLEAQANWSKVSAPPSVAPASSRLAATG